MSTKIAVNIPVKDLAESSRFFAGLGFPINEQLANENMEAHVISDDIYLLLVAAPYFKTITKKELPDATTSEAILQLQVDSRQCVDE
jgi:predicted lactoylglutathione lyase